MSCRYDQPEPIGERGNFTTWERELDAATADDGPIIACTLSAEQLREQFDCGYGIQGGAPFTAWTKRYVYFPVDYDGHEWVGRAPRDPCDEATDHQGGGG